MEVKFAIFFLILPLPYYYVSCGQEGAGGLRTLIDVYLNPYDPLTRLATKFWNHVFFKNKKVNKPFVDTFPQSHFPPIMKTTSTPSSTTTKLPGVASPVSTASPSLEPEVTTSTSTEPISYTPTTGLPPQQEFPPEGGLGGPQQPDPTGQGGSLPPFVPGQFQPPGQNGQFIGPQFPPQFQNPNLPPQPPPSQFLPGGGAGGGVPPPLPPPEFQIPPNPSNNNPPFGPAGPLGGAQSIHQRDNTSSVDLDDTSTSYSPITSIEEILELQDDSTTTTKTTDRLEEIPLLLPLAQKRKLSALHPIYALIHG